MHKDIVCGKDVTTQEFHTTYGDRPYYFCSKKCEMDFVGNPLKYVDKSQSAASTEGSPKILPGGKEVKSHT